MWSWHCTETLLKPQEDNVRADIHTAACQGPHAEAGGCALKEAETHEEPRTPCWCSPLLKDYIPW